ncbi:hypothetical protein [Phenylobacterium sp.]|jgi:hypothetical protein|uniref:hypothetical protein n=1 Tax=Phenylobacterium sp. TaxID=1871053 RepID=UPI002F92EC8F
MAVTAAIDEVYRVISAAVDGAFYRSAYPDVAAAGLDPVRHYAESGWREGRDPVPWFSSRAYLDANPDVRSRGVEPFFHYLTAGRRQGREIEPSDRAEAYLAALSRAGQSYGWSFQPLETAPAPLDLSEPGPPPMEDPPAEPEPAPVEDPPPEPVSEPAPEPQAGPTAEELRALDRAVVEPEFDAYWYLQNYRDVAAAGVDPLDHFVASGWREGRNPTPWFSIRDYLETNPDVALAGVNPFVHYLRDGRREGREPRHRRGFRYDIIENLTPATARVARARTLAAKIDAKPVEALVKALQKSRTGLRDLHISFSHDDYRQHLGGVQLCLQREDLAFERLCRDHLHILPAKAWPVTREPGEPGQLGVVFNRQRIGSFAPADVAEALRRAAPLPGRRSFAVHSLLGHTADEVADIVEAAGLTAGFFWLHDFASLCAGFHLLRNDVEDCAAPPPDSGGCRICTYLPLRRRHLDQHGRLFERLDLTVVAPSEPTLKLWRESWDYPHAGEVVLPHAALIPRGRGLRPGPRPLRVAFAGTPSALKGWPIFRELAVRHAQDDRYRFYHLGGRRQPGLPVEFLEVSVGRETPHAMRDALEALDIDVVLVWPICRETFSFTAYEAVAAGCAVITWPDSGNVQAFARAGGHGWVLDDEAALEAAFVSGEAEALGRSRRKPKLYDLQFSAMTADLVEAGT